jgi:SAM-dependent methyltransferase
MSASTQLPFPPLELANRVGSLEGAADPFEHFDRLGAAARRDLEAMLPHDWKWEGKRVLDFGCGAGRTLRHWLPESEIASFAGCDIDEESVAWLRSHLSPPFEVFRNDAEPPLPVADGDFDLVYAVSVFTHLTSSWSSWLAELHRILAPDGILLLTFMGPGIAELISGEPWDATHTGMFTFREGQSWDLGGPMVLHSEWWIREHWERAFDFLAVQNEGFGSVGGESQGIVTLRRRDVAVDPEMLERIDSAESREAPALQRNLAFVQREVVELREALATSERERAALADAARRAAEAEAQLQRIRSAHDLVVGSKSWRLTSPLRSAVARARRIGGR